MTDLPTAANSQTRFFMFLISQVSPYANYFIKNKKPIRITPLISLRIRTGGGQDKGARKEWGEEDDLAFSSNFVVVLS